MRCLAGCRWHWNRSSHPEGAVAGPLAGPFHVLFQDAVQTRAQVTEAIKTATSQFQRGPAYSVILKASVSFQRAPNCSTSFSMRVKKNRSFLRHHVDLLKAIEIVGLNRPSQSAVRGRWPQSICSGLTFEENAVHEMFAQFGVKKGLPKTARSRSVISWASRHLRTYRFRHSSVVPCHPNGLN